MFVNTVQAHCVCFPHQRKGTFLGGYLQGFCQAGSRNKQAAWPNGK